jgi:hypothetical protein
LLYSTSRAWQLRMGIVLVRSISNGMSVDDISGASPTRSLLHMT